MGPFSERLIDRRLFGAHSERKSQTAVANGLTRDVHVDLQRGCRVELTIYSQWYNRFGGHVPVSAIG